MLQCLRPEDAGDRPAELAISERDRLLIGLQEQIFGPTLNAFAACPSCGTSLEFNLRTSDLFEHSHSCEEGQARVMDIVAGDYQVSFRRPTSADLAAAAEVESPNGRRAVVFERCVESVTRSGAPLGWTEIPEEVIAELEERLESAGLGGEILLNLVCPACRFAWTVDFDIASYLYAEISGLARQILEEVGALAAAYGWSEDEILAMPRLRRRFYLDRVR